MNYQEVKKLFAPIFKSHGYTQLSNKRSYIKDKGFGFIFFEITPAHGFGFQLGSCICFFWNDHAYVTYDYYYNNGQVHGRPSGQTDLMVFEFPSFSTDLEYMISDLEKHFEFYEKLTLEMLENELTRCYKGTDKHIFAQKHRGIIKLLFDKKDEAVAIINDLHESDLATRALLNYVDDYNALCNRILEIINKAREDQSQSLKLKNKLEPITMEQLMEIKTMPYVPQVSQ